MTKSNQSDLLRAMILTKNAYVQPCCSALSLEFEHHITAGSNKRMAEMQVTRATLAQSGKKKTMTINF